MPNWRRMESRSNRGYVDRLHAGRQLALSLESYRDRDGVVLGLARGGVAVGYAVAEVLDLPLQALVVRKLGAPDNPELAIGAISETGARWLDRQLAQQVGADDAYIQLDSERQILEAQRQQSEFQVGRGVDLVKGRLAIIVDDGIATGASALVGIMSARDLGASEVVLATPVASTHAVHLLKPVADQLVAPLVPDSFHAVGIYYQRFEQVTDAEVVEYLRRASER